MSSKTSRARKVPLRQPAVSPSLTSIFSSLTQTSNGSSGSSSTVTQESVFRGKHRSQKSSSGRRLSSQPKKSNRKESTSTSVESEKPNVFAFMEEEDEDGDGAEEADTVGELKTEAEPVMPIEEEPVEVIQERVLPVAPSPPISAEIPFAPGVLDRAPASRPLSMASLHSDSGISIRSSSPEPLPPVQTRKTASKSAFRSSNRSRQAMRARSTSSTTSTSSQNSAQQYDEAPELFYPRVTGSTNHVQDMNSQNNVPEQHDRIKTISFKVRRVKPPQPSKSGYDLLASSLSTVDEDGLKPIYRRFEALNNRVLLILQDEIVTMENDLAVMDQRIAEAEGPISRPISRRSEFIDPTPLQQQRMALCGFLVTKLHQYSLSDPY
jgi:hypothetical protein